jgi:hypothetical protein
VGLVMSQSLDGAAGAPGGVLHGEMAARAPAGTLRVLALQAAAALAAIAAVYRLT